MKYVLCAVACGLLAAVLAWGWVAERGVAQEGLPAAGAATPPSATSADRVDPQRHSYAIGLDLGTSFRADGIALDVDNLLAGVRDGIEQAQPRFSPEECEAALAQLAAARMALFRQRNEQFLQTNRQAEGVQTLPSGLQYRVIAAGEGPSPGPQSTVRVHYRGQLIDGAVFDQSFGGEPAVLGVAQVIPGWTEALQKMRVGDRWMLFIPSALAYGERGFGEVIPPHSTLVFELQLLDVVQ
jgi:FKBP-type peptidyl-prolyl cis-trans isomerase FklB